MGEQTSPRSALERVRQATRALHQDLEGLIESLGLLTRRDLLAIHLEILRAHFVSQERRVAAHPDLHSLLAERAAELQSDVALLGGDRGFDEAILRRPYDRAEALGLLYVVEGSRLGTHAISQRLQAAGVGVAGMASFARTPHELRVKWLAFCQALEAVPVEQWPAMTATATFHFAELVERHSAIKARLTRSSRDVACETEPSH